MGILAQIDMELQKDLIEFVKVQDKKPYPHTLGDVLMNEILKDIIKGDARISGCVTNHGKKIMYLEITFYDMKESEGEADDGSV